MEIKVLCHSSIKIISNKIIYADPFKIKEKSNDADLIIITHSHYDHFSEEDIKKIQKVETLICITPDLLEKTISLGFKKENITHYYSISDDDAITMSKMLAKELGLGVGISSGANFLGSVLLNEDVNNVVTIFSDDNKKYLSILKDDVFIKQDYISNDIKLLDYEVV